MYVSRKTGKNVRSFFIFNFIQEKAKKNCNQRTKAVNYRVPIKPL